MSGGSGEDILDASTFISSLSGNTSGSNAVLGGTGDDAITADHETEDDTLFGVSFSVTLENFLEGGAGDDTIAATITALAEATVIGQNLLEGGDGNDDLTASIVAETLFAKVRSSPLTI